MSYRCLMVVNPAPSDAKRNNCNFLFIRGCATETTP